MKPVAEFTIDRSKLIKGVFYDRPTRRMCSVGQYLAASGFPHSPVEMASDYCRLLMPLNRRDATDSSSYARITELNDIIMVLDITRAEKRTELEGKIVAAFAEAGVTCEFTGDYTT